MRKLVGVVSWRRVLIWALWVTSFVASFVLASLIATLLVMVARGMGIAWSVETTMGNLIFRLVMYVIMALLLLALPFLFAKRMSLSLKRLGIGRVLRYGDIGLALAGVVVYGLFTIVTQLALSKVPGIDVTQTQNLGLSTHLVGGELLAAYIVLVVLTPLFEEFIFRGVLYGELRDHHMTKWPAILIVSVLFGVAHGQWNVGLDVFCLSVVACYLRDITGTIWPGVVLHILKNAVAFWFVFVASQSMTG